MANKAESAFNGYHVTFYNHETRQIDSESFASVEEVMERDFEAFPSASKLADDLYHVFADVVGRITDNDGNVLYDNMKAMERTA